MKSSNRNSSSIVRLQVAISHRTPHSRRKAEQLIDSGHVRVNGKIVTKLGTKVDMNVDQISIDNKPVFEKFHTYMIFHKPPAVIAQKFDFDRPSLKQYVAPKMLNKLYVANTLGYYYSGLLLLTDDPKFKNCHLKMDHAFRAKITAGRPIDAKIFSKFKSTIKNLAITRVNDTLCWIKFDSSFATAKNYLDHLNFRGVTVEKAQLVKLGPLTLKIQPGRHRQLTRPEIRKLLSSPAP